MELNEYRALAFGLLVLLILLIAFHFLVWRKYRYYKTQYQSLKSSTITHISDNLPASQEPEHNKLEEKNKKLFQMSEVVYREKKRVEEENELLKKAKEALEEEKQKFKEKNSKLWQQSIAVHKEKERINALKQEVQHRHNEILDSIAYAKRIQESILPSKRIFEEELKQSFILHIPKDVVAGDFYWLERRAHLVYFAVADCTGHGVPGALVSIVCAHSLSAALQEEGITETGKLLTRTRELVIDKLTKSNSEVNDGMDISLCAFDRESLSLEWSGANSPLWIVSPRQTIVEEVEPIQLNGDQLWLHELKPDKQPIGRYDRMKPFTSSHINLQQGELLYLFTDGFADQFGGAYVKKFKYRPFKELLLSIAQKPLDDQQKLIYDSFRDWKGNHGQTDDVCVMGVKV